MEVLNLEFSDYERTQNPATKPKFAWAKNNHEITKLAGVQYVACSVKETDLRRDSETPTPTGLEASTAGRTPPIYTAVRPPFVWLDLPGFSALKKGKPNSTPPICTAVRLPFVRQYASHLYGRAFGSLLPARSLSFFSKNVSASCLSAFSVNFL